MTVLTTIKLRRAVDDSQKSFLTEDVFYADLRGGSDILNSGLSKLTNEIETV